ncbi:pyrimidine dimer DNA glycosylase /DNA-(apurinic or apyrimidinic site) lyase [Nitrosospira sp. Nsp2]|uniref:pyrimidine dimer DNA glycosylase/endonuclease V n=2 Tax=unclassified Nitrosospira TaxID=2609267 RepID=UPI000D31DCF0|nr:pyrimidine dimer DNA glycosylase/endonuclease V [Nitrosospira sp. Nsp2]PTR13502.1 pyrimidine dimer DNA glycosylase /DNA-(apurinic or apyrimidinic site) lyase [Nitrosospira sp. Nsp2]
MRLWTLHPRYLDARGLTAAWREALLAQKVLSGLTTGYAHHPQLIRFRRHPQPLMAVGVFLAGLAGEAERRGYHFDTAKILKMGSVRQIDETDGQLLLEWSHLNEKLRKRAPHLYQQFQDIRIPEPHPLFRVVPGGIRDWEKQRVNKGPQAIPEP